MPRVARVSLCCAVALLAVSCRTASAPQSMAGVRALYRSIGVDASTSNFSDICRSFMNERLLDELKPLTKNCSTRRFERWAEKVRLSKGKPGTHIVLSGREAVIHDGPRPEKALYAAGQWRLAEVPEIMPPRDPARR